MKNKKHLSITSIGLVQSTGQTSLKVLLTRQPAQMWNYWVIKLFSRQGPKQGYLGRAEVESLIGLEEARDELAKQSWGFAPPSLFLCGKAEDGMWATLKLGRTFTVPHMSKELLVGVHYYPRLQTGDGRVRAFGLASQSEIFTKKGQLRVGIRFPVVRIEK